MNPSFDIKLMTLLAHEDVVLISEDNPDYDLRISFEEENALIEDMPVGSNSLELILRFSLFDRESNQMDAGSVSRALNQFGEKLSSKELASLAREVFEQIYVYRVAGGKIEARVRRDFPLEQENPEESSGPATVH